MGYGIEKMLKEWAGSIDLKGLDETVKYLEELGEKAKNIKTADEAYDFAKELGVKCTREEFDEGYKTLEYISNQVENATNEAKKMAENAYMDAVAVYMTAEKRLKAASEEYSKYSKELQNEFEENRKLAPEYAENAAKKLEADAKKFYGEVQNVLKSDDVKGYLDFSKNIEKLGKRISKAKSTKEAYEIATDLGLDCSWEDFKKTAKSLGIYTKE